MTAHYQNETELEFNHRNPTATSRPRVASSVHSLWKDTHDLMILLQARAPISAFFVADSQLKALPDSRFWQ